MAYRYKSQSVAVLAPILRGLVLDIGCADRSLQARLPTAVQYVGLDYPPTADALYRTRPDVFADAAQLPFADGVFDAVTLLDVLEHLREPGAAIAECARVLAPGGVLAVTVPFLYPLHDAPFDFRRWTLFGLQRLMDQNGLVVHHIKPLGQPAETAALLSNIATAKRLLRLLARHSLWFLPLALLAAILIPLRNLLAWTVAYTTPPDDLMPLGYRLICRKPSPDVR